MNIHYKERKSPIGLSGKWAIPIGNYHIDCFVWINKDSLLENVAHTDEDVVACYVHNPNRKLVGGLFGEIHVLEDEARPGTIAHELTHALLDYIYHILDPKNPSPIFFERLSWIMETMTRIYWEEYFKVFLTEEIAPEMESSTDEVSGVGNQPAELENSPTNPDYDRGNEEAQL